MKYFQIKINKEAWLYLIILSLLMIVFYPFFPFVGTCILILLIFTAYFFRDPDKIVPNNEDLILSPADGIITYIGPAEAPIESGTNNKNYNKVSVFLSIFDIHINRVPASGKILMCNYIKGKFLNATLDKSSNENERQSVKIRTHDGTEIALVQIAGLVARRIVCWIKVDQPVGVGDRIGMIRFGSRVDIYLPNDVAPLVVSGQRVIGGETILADMQSNEKARKGSAR